MSLTRRDHILQLMMAAICFSQLSTGFAGAWNYREHTQINWREYDAAAFTEAKQQNKLLYIFIYSDLCAWCRKFETETLEKPAIRQLLQSQFIPVLVDQAKQAELANQLGIKLVPADILVAHDGKRLLRFYGFLPPQALSDALGKTLVSWRKGEIVHDEFGDQSTCCPIPEGH